MTVIPPRQFQMALYSYIGTLIWLSELQDDTSPGKPFWAEIDFWLFRPLPGSAWADWKLAELAEQLGKMVKHPK